MKFLIVLVAALAIAAANPERERRSLGWGHNGAVVLGGVVPGVAVAGPVAPAAAVVGPVAGSAAVVGPVGPSAAVVGPAAGSAVVAGPAGTVVAPGHGAWNGVVGLW
ncbi:apidermin 1 [Colletes latitarsis]|uniref:apidermin 1 n=1 Tax=Colletes latitarsis TaxID=2605962 RepID=UPI0040354B04